MRILPRAGLRQAAFRNKPLNLDFYPSGQDRKPLTVAAVLRLTGHGFGTLRDDPRRVEDLLRRGLRGVGGGDLRPGGALTTVSGLTTQAFFRQRLFDAPELEIGP